MSEESYRVIDLQERVHRKQAVIYRLTEELHSERNKWHKVINDQAAQISKLQGTLLFDDCVLALAKDMQFKLDKNKHKECATMNPDGKGRGWSHCEPFWLTGRIEDELKELTKELTSHLQEPDKFPAKDVQLECADVANFAMMIHDNIAKAISTAPVCETCGGTKIEPTIKSDTDYPCYECQPRPREESDCQPQEGDRP